MLFSEYRFFRSQSDLLIELQDEYRNYLFILRRICDETQKEKSDIVVDFSTDEKKNSFVVINRKPEYLKQSFVDYLKEQKLGNKLDELKHLRISSDKNFSKKTIKSKSTLRRKKIIRNDLISLFNKNIKNDGLFMWPLKPKEFWISSFFGRRRMRNKKSSFHHGLDLAALKGTEVKAAADGVVVEAFFSSGYGNTILIVHDKRYKTRYAHLDKIVVKCGTNVKRGERIGTVGDTGFVRSAGNDPSHLHFEIIDFGTRINPLHVLK